MALLLGATTQHIILYHNQVYQTISPLNVVDIAVLSRYMISTLAGTELQAQHTELSLSSAAIGTSFEVTA